MAHSIADDHTNPIQQRTVLLATDSKNSVLAEVVAGKTNHIAYSAYGHQSAQQEAMTRLGFNGELREVQTSWYLLGNGYRAYNPRLMRFHSPDSWSPFGAGGLNTYTYCGGEPVMNSDPSGHAWWSRIGKLFRNIADQFAWPNSRRSPLPKNPVSIEDAADAARTLQASVKEVPSKRPKGGILDVAAAVVGNMEQNRRPPSIGGSGGKRKHAPPTWKGQNSAPSSATRETVASRTATAASAQPADTSPAPSSVPSRANSIRSESSWTSDFERRFKALKEAT